MLFRKGNVLNIDGPIKYGFNGGTIIQRLEFEYWLSWFTYNYGLEFENVQNHEGWTVSWNDEYWTSAYSGLEGHNMTWDQSLWNINFNSAYYTSTYNYQRYSSCHEIFHGLGAEHGMKNPDGPNWKSYEARAELLRVHGYSENYISQVLMPLNEENYIITPFDEDSFMDYPIDCNHTIDNQLCGNSNMVASPQDIYDMGVQLGVDNAKLSKALSMEDWDKIHGYPFKDARNYKVNIPFSTFPTAIRFKQQIQEMF